MSELDPKLKKLIGKWKIERMKWDCMVAEHPPCQPIDTDDADKVDLFDGMVEITEKRYRDTSRLRFNMRSNTIVEDFPINSRRGWSITHLNENNDLAYKDKWVYEVIDWQEDSFIFFIPYTQYRDGHKIRVDLVRLPEAPA